MRVRFLVALATLPLAGCAGGYGGVDYVNGAPPGAIAYDGFYDNYYGPIYGGYWGNGNVFYYRHTPHGRFVADRGNHFRRGPDASPGFHSMHGMGPGPGAGRGGRPSGPGRHH